MTEKQPALETARTEEQTTTRLRIDGPTLSHRPDPDAGSASRAVTPAASAASGSRSSAGPPHDRPSPPYAPYAAPAPAPVPWLAQPKLWLGVVITCLLGALPIIALVLVRKPGSALEVPPTPTEVIETAAAPTPVSGVSAPAAADSEPELEREPEVLPAPLEPRIALAAVPSARSKSTPTFHSPPSSRPNPTVSSPAPLRTSWFHR